MPRNYFIVVNVNAKIYQISLIVKLNAYECINLDVDPKNGQITAIIIKRVIGNMARYLLILTVKIMNILLVFFDLNTIV